MLVEWQPSNKTHGIDLSPAISMSQVRGAEMSMWQRRSALSNSGVFPLSQLTFCSNWVKWRGADCFKSGAFTQVMTESPDIKAIQSADCFVYVFIVLLFFLYFCHLHQFSEMWQALCVCGYYARNIWRHGTALSFPTPHHSMAFQALVFYRRGREEKVSRKSMACELSTSCPLRKCSASSAIVLATTMLACPSTRTKQLWRKPSSILTENKSLFLSLRLFLSCIWSQRQER